MAPVAIYSGLILTVAIEAGIHLPFPEWPRRRDGSRLHVAVACSAIDLAADRMRLVRKVKMSGKLIHLLPRQRKALFVKRTDFLFFGAVGHGAGMAGQANILGWQSSPLGVVKESVTVSASQSDVDVFLVVKSNGLLDLRTGGNEQRHQQCTQETCPSQF